MKASRADSPGCDRCRYLPDSFLNKRASALIGWNRSFNQLTVVLVGLLFVAFLMYWADIMHRRVLVEADRKLNHEENQTIIRLVKESCVR